MKIEGNFQPQSMTPLHTEKSDAWPAEVDQAREELLNIQREIERHIADDTPISQEELTQMKNKMEEISTLLENGKKSASPEQLKEIEAAQEECSYFIRNYWDDDPYFLSGVNRTILCHLPADTAPYQDISTLKNEVVELLEELKRLSSEDRELKPSEVADIQNRMYTLAGEITTHILKSSPPLSEDAANRLRFCAGLLSENAIDIPFYGEDAQVLLEELINHVVKEVKWMLYG